jgi:biotin carboxyl carrier protein
VEGQSLEFRLAPPPVVEDAVRHAARTEGVELLTAPMPGRVVAVRRRAGEPVTAHEPVVVLEAMKMEHTISAPLGGTVTAVHVEPGDQVQRGDVLAEVSA